MAAAVDEGWVVQVLVERPEGEALVGLEALSTLVNALPVRGATVSWRRDRCLLELPVAAGDVREALTAALELSSDARRQTGLAGWPVRSCAVFDGAEYTAVRASGRTPALDTEPGQGR
ncbi:MAG: hypothetical protein M3O70_23005 [Actinomycetota bacterium]|nr:hypothetical protein [Actinomycetota bacterium]